MPSGATEPLPIFYSDDCCLSHIDSMHFEAFIQQFEQDLYVNVRI